MTLDPQKPVQTRDGRKARIVPERLSNKTFPIVAYITERDGTEEPRTYCAHGGYWDDGQECDHDLINIPERITREVWVNVYEDYEETFLSKSTANMNSKYGRIGCVPIQLDFEKGAGL